MRKAQNKKLKPRIGAIVQARTGSERLPDKILKELPCGERTTVLEQVIRRLKKSNELDMVIVATTVKEGDNSVVHIARKEGVEYFRGSETDVLSRYYLSARENDLDVIVRISSDCPCIDGKVVDSCIKEHMRTKADYTSNTLKRTFPRGLDVEVFNKAVLERSHRDADKAYEKEHVTPYIYQHPQIFKCVNVEAAKDLAAPQIRIALDTEEDYALLCAVFDYLYYGDNFFGVREIVRLFRRKPWLKLINNNVVQKEI